MNTWSSYTLQDFIPFTADIYFRLLERMSETFWPLHLMTLALGVAAVWLALKNRTRLASVLMAAVWGFVGFAFFIQRYAELNWAGGYIGYCFLAQATLLLLIALTGVGFGSRPRKSPATDIGVAIALVGLIGLPLVTPFTGGSWFRAEVFGIHADPTAITTLGLLLIMFRGWGLWLIAIIPALWLLISGLTLWVLGAPSAIVLFIVLAIGLIGLVWKSVEYRSV
ncbi:DUF6064 family protein [Methylophaga nitratireducenticrescens]|uniref:Uncharacterized protein n=1 Tax=Methylophaga nitratireducenticrescens TaxID=754476 RepID=I1XME0_METNJ|nr:DUF6064 family protein [Methylophaga nitratireducenticrescens]AFI85559.1 MFS transporter permease [Methylophaga nitratireducenticrescens]AUZ85296.1 MFS transporter permease [Methylophaga nitratireducenticrescens]